MKTSPAVAWVIRREMFFYYGYTILYTKDVMVKDGIIHLPLYGKLVNIRLLFYSYSAGSSSSDAAITS